MSIKMNLRADENSSYIIEIDFFLVTFNGSKKDLIVNDDLTWTLYDEDRNIINLKESVPIQVAKKVGIVLSENDLLLNNNYPQKRFLVISGTYNNGLSTNASFLEEILFQIEDAVEGV